MHRRHFLQQTGLAFGALTLAQQSILTKLFDDPWKITMLTDKVGIFVERGGTILFLLEKDGIAVVDSQFPDQSKHLIDELKKKNEQPIAYLINTHHHGDHSSGNISFKGIAAHVVAHANSKTNQENVAKKDNKEAAQLYPDLTYTDTWAEKVGKEKIRLHYFGAGHTNGDSFVHLENSNIVHTGDLHFNRRHPFVDRSSGANIKSWIDVLGKATSTFNAETKYVFGHSGNGYEVTGKADDLKKFADYLNRLLLFTEGEIKAGKPKEEILKTTALPGETEWIGDGFTRPLTAAYEELTTAAKVN